MRTTLSARLFKLAGRFGGVYATKVLDVLSDYPKSALSKLAYRYLHAPSTVTHEALVEALETFPKPDRAHSILEWPVEFWEALGEMTDRHTQGLPSSEMGEIDPGMSPGVSVRVVEEFLTFMLTMEREGLRGDAGVSPWSEPERLARQVLGRIRTVVDRLPAVWRKYIEDYIAFSVTFSADAETNERVVKAVQRHKLAEHFGLKWHKGRSMVPPDPEEVHSTYGYYDADNRAIHLYPQHKTTTIAHEIGHAVWDRAMSPRLLKFFLKRQLAKTVRGLKMRGVREEWAEEDVDEFFRSFRRALGGMTLRNTKTWVREMESMWGKDYAEQQKETALVRGIGNLHPLVEDQEDVIDHVVDENKSLLTTWNEAWAEGFVDKLLQTHPELTVPGVIMVLIDDILTLGQLP